MSKIYLSSREHSLPDRITAEKICLKLIGGETAVDICFPYYEETEARNDALCFKTANILRIAGEMMASPDSKAGKEFAAKNPGAAGVLTCELPKIKAELNQRESSYSGFSESDRVHSVRVRLTTAVKDAPAAEADEKVFVTVKPGSKPAGSLASHAVRSLVGGNGRISLCFIMTEHNHEAMAGKVMAALRIARRMLMDPGCIISKDLPPTSMGYEAAMSVPCQERVKIKQKDGTESEDEVLSTRIDLCIK